MSIASFAIVLDQNPGRARADGFFMRFILDNFGKKHGR
jgi:hypothetical protein